MQMDAHWMLTARSIRQFFNNINQANFDDVKVVCCGSDKISISVNNYIKSVLDRYADSTENRDYCLAMCALYDVGEQAYKYVHYL